MTRPKCPTCGGSLKRISVVGEVPCTNCDGGYMRGIDDPTPEEAEVFRLRDELRAARARNDAITMLAARVLVCPLPDLPKHLAALATHVAVERSAEPAPDFDCEHGVGPITPATPEVAEARAQALSVAIEARSDDLKAENARLQDEVESLTAAVERWRGIAINTMDADAIAKSLVSPVGRGGSR